MVIDWHRTRKLAPWITRDVLWTAQGVVLSVVSAYYTFRFAVEHDFPVWLAWSLFMALELSAAIGLVVYARPRDQTARYHAVALVIGAVALAAVVNGLQHAMDRDLIEVSSPGVLLTGAIIPVMLAWSSHVARGMAPRPQAEEPVKISTEPEVEEPEPASFPSVQPLPPFVPRAPTRTLVVPPLEDCVPDTVPEGRSDAELIAVLQRDWQARGRRPGEDRMARALGISRARVRQLLSDLPDPSVQANGSKR